MKKTNNTGLVLGPEKSGHENKQKGTGAVIGVVVFCAVMFLFGSADGYARSVDLQVSVSNPYLLSGTRQTVYLKVGLTGTELEETIERPGVNVAIVLDSSGSMDGEKIRQAKEAALLAVDMLNAKDIVSIVTYADTVSVLVPATRVTEKEYICNRIRSIFADGSTALFAGVSKGADEVSKFLERERVNRVILLSDGLANVGPSSPMALGNLGASLKRIGISVTTIGLGTGYNEDLMVQLAAKSDGNHSFVENYNDLTRIFRYEFNDLLSVVAQDVEIEILCSEGIRPVKILGREAEIIGEKVYTSISQLYSKQEKYLMLELDVPPKSEGDSVDVAQVRVSYNNMETNRTENLAGSARVAFTRSQTVVEERKDRGTLVEAAKQIAADISEEAIRLRDEGRVEEAQQLLKQGSAFLMKEAEELESGELEEMGQASSADAEVLDDEKSWNSNRKRMKADTYEVQNQQSY